MEHIKEGKRPLLFDRYFSFVEALYPSDKLLFFIVLFIFLGSSFALLISFSEQNKKIIPTNGGTLVEGIVGTPRFVNPVLAISHADQDMVALMYSGLMRLGSDGDLVNDIAESVTISEDGKVYNVVLQQNIFFHDGIRLTAEDVAYTIGLIQDSSLKSPLRGNWNDVVVEILGEYELNFVLNEPYTPFIENLTVGILPKHVWGELTIEQLPFSQHNTEPIGTGPYALLNVGNNSSGLIETYILTAYPRSEPKAKILEFKVNFYPNEEALITAFKEKKITSTAAFSYNTLSQVDTNTYNNIEQPLPRVFTVFLNQNKSVALRDKSVRKALNAAIDRDALIEYALDGHGVPTDSPIPPGFLTIESDATSTVNTTATTTSGLLQAETILIDAGWVQQEDGSWQKEIDGEETKLAIVISTANTEVFKKTAEYIKSVWDELGVETTVAFFEQTDLVQVIIRPRDYQALLFGTDYGHTLDMYPFWHSSQKNDPGLNVALYTNITTDTLLETARTTQDVAEQIDALSSFEKELMDETPAIFLYSPTFTYVIRNDVNVAFPTQIVRASERFSEIYKWHMEESHVWPIFEN